MNAFLQRDVLGPLAEPRAAGKITVVLFGEFGPPLLTAARSLHKAGISVAVLGFGKQTPLDWSNAISVAASMPYEQVGTRSGLAFLCNFLEQTEAQALLPLWDAQMSWLAEHEHSLPVGCRLLCSGKQTLERIRAKHEQIGIASRSGFQILPTWKLFSSSDVAAIDAAAFPICVRPSVSSTVRPSFKAEVIHSLVELRAFLSQRMWGPEPLLVQPFSSLPTIVVHGVRSERGELMELEAFLPSMRFEGVSLELVPMPLNHRLVQMCRKFADEANLTGPFHFDLLYCAETVSYFFLEVNARLGGTTDKVVKLGFDEPLLTLLAYGFDVRVKPYRFQAGRASVNRRALLKHIRALLHGYLSPLDFPVAGRFRHLLLSLRSFLFDQDSIASAQDLRGTWYFYLGSRYAGRRRSRSAAMLYP